MVMEKTNMQAIETTSTHPEDTYALIIQKEVVDTRGKGIAHKTTLTLEMFQCSM